MKGGFLRLAKGVVAAPLEATCKGRVIDYFVVSEGLAKARVIHSITTMSEAPFGPHFPVRLLMRAAPREHKIRRLVRQAKVGPSFPSGCLNKYKVPRKEVSGDGHDDGIHCGVPGDG